MKLRLSLLFVCAIFALTSKAEADFTETLFGPNVHVYKPTDCMDSIHADVERIHSKLFNKDFSRDRYALLFMPGDYREAGLLHIPFYVHAAGLGKTPLEVKVSNVHTPPHLPDGNCTCTFWRSIENLSVIGRETYDEEETFKWSVSQAAPIRRVYSERTVRHQWGKGWVSGGFTADCWFVAPVGSDHQQQWYTRNSLLEKGRGEFREMKYNYVFQGVELGKDVDKSTYTDNWDRGGNVTFVPQTPIIREKPFLFIGDDGRYKVFRPALRRNASGLSWSKDRIGDGEEIDLQSAFYLVKPGASASEINRQLSQGKHIMFLPGIFVLEEPLRVSRPNTIVMGLGWSTVVPGETNPEAAIIVEDVDGVSICSLLFDAHYSSHSLLSVRGSKRHRRNPTLLADLFFRVGGFRPAPVHVDCALEIAQSDVIGDHFWLWRADHGVRGSVGWNVNTAPIGLHVTGNHVIIYGLFNEHFQQYQALWDGENGRTFFYQCETPYDAPSQDVYMSHDGTVKGFAAYKVGDMVRHHEATGFGIYDVLFNSEIRIESSVEVPEKKGIKLRHICNNSLSNPGPQGFGFIVNHNTPSTYNTWRDNRTYVDKLDF
ncbi:MAG: glycoside hydrolase family 16 [Bacteroidaceae bacterium]|nr:glycoside hydrolase family 16 [Bacteroidaceae bacterium]